MGQDRALEELFRLLSIHSRQISVTPVVVMFSGEFYSVAFDGYHFDASSFALGPVQSHMDSSMDLS